MVKRKRFPYEVNPAVRESPSRTIILFDGLCYLCTGSVQFILRHDRKRKFLFASLQGKTGQELIKRLQLSAPSADSFVLVEDGKAYQRSTAALRVARLLGGWWFLGCLFILVPRCLRDAVYDWIARNRYGWFGKREECWLPAPDVVERFLE